MGMPQLLEFRHCRAADLTTNLIQIPMQRRSRLALAAIMLSMFASGAQAQMVPRTLVNPGAWEVTPQTAGGASVSYRVCFVHGDLDDLRQLLPNLNNGAECPAARVSVDGATVTWEMDCPAKGFRGEGRYALSTISVHGSITLSQGSPPAASVQTIEARQVGACPAR